MATRTELRAYRTKGGEKPVVVRFGGPKWLHVLIMDRQLSVIKVPASDERYMRELTFKNKPYPFNRAMRIFRSYGYSHGLTSGAKAFLRETSVTT